MALTERLALLADAYMQAKREYRERQEMREKSHVGPYTADFTDSELEAQVSAKAIALAEFIAEHVEYIIQYSNLDDDWFEYIGKGTCYVHKSAEGTRTVCGYKGDDLFHDRDPELNYLWCPECYPELAAKERR